jgi:hypothetical protein
MARTLMIIFWLLAAKSEDGCADRGAYCAESRMTTSVCALEECD